MALSRLELNQPCRSAPFSAVSIEVHAQGELVHKGASGVAFLLISQ